jgi:hypothetical protein
MMPLCGGSTAQAIEPSTSRALAAASTSAIVDQRNRVASAIPPMVVA